LAMSITGWWQKNVKNEQENIVHASL
jgi:hypothetical protein